MSDVRLSKPQLAQKLSLKRLLAHRIEKAKGNASLLAMLEDEKTELNKQLPYEERL